jgi:hypothetical protein
MEECRYFLYKILSYLAQISALFCGTLFRALSRRPQLRISFHTFHNRRLKQQPVVVQPVQWVVVMVVEIAALNLLYSYENDYIRISLKLECVFDLPIEAEPVGASSADGGRGGGISMTEG